MESKFKEGDIVAITVEYQLLGLAVGDKGEIWCIYNTSPPSYEVTFSKDGGSFDFLCEEGELVKV